MNAALSCSRRILRAPSLPASRILLNNRLLTSPIHRRLLSTSTMANIPQLKLSDGNSIPMLGFGTGTAMFKRSSEPQHLDEERISQILTAIKLGYRHLDGAETYNTEAELGQAVKRSGIPREEFYITTKCSKDRLHEVRTSFEESLEKLGVGYVDLYLFHAPFIDGVGDERRDEIIKGAWKVAQELKEEGKVKSIGVSNFSERHLELLDPKPAVNQIEYHVYLQQPSLISYMQQKNISIAAYGPLVPITKARPGPADDILSKLAQKYSVGEGEVCLRWCIDQDVVPISTSSKESRLKGYLGICGFKLSQEEVKEISDAGKGKHFRAFWGSKYTDDPK